MTTLVDSCVWINYFKGIESIQTKKLKKLLESGETIGTTPVIIQEVLQGLRDEKTVATIQTVFEGLDCVEFNFQDAVSAAHKFRSLRKKGLTLATVDLLIAQVCSRMKWSLLTSDQDFYLLGDFIKLSV